MLKMQTSGHLGSSRQDFQLHQIPYSVRNGQILLRKGPPENHLGGRFFKRGRDQDYFGALLFRIVETTSIFGIFYPD